MAELQQTKSTERKSNIRRGQKSSETYQPQCLASRYLHGEEDLVVRHIQNDLVLRDQDVTAAVSVGTEGGVGVA